MTCSPFFVRLIPIEDEAGCGVAIPIPDHILDQLGWDVGTEVELEIIGHTIEVRAKDPTI